eukprot:4166145-Amphidinium_carterae.2
MCPDGFQYRCDGNDYKSNSQISKIVAPEKATHSRIYTVLSQCSRTQCAQVLYYLTPPLELAHWTHSHCQSSVKFIHKFCILCTVMDVILRLSLLCTLVLCDITDL